GSAPARPTLEDKIVQGAVAEMLSAIYEIGERRLEGIEQRLGREAAAAMSLTVVAARAYPSDRQDRGSSYSIDKPYRRQSLGLVRHRQAWQSAKWRSYRYDTNRKADSPAKGRAARRLLLMDKARLTIIVQRSWMDRYGEVDRHHVPHLQGRQRG